MKVKENILKLIAAAILLVLPAVSFAVSKEDMEQARTIAAKAYLRYANDGSGYLDELNPKTMAELEAVIKPKEQENLKAFKAIPVPTDYASWDKAKLVEYWGVTAFQDKNLLDKGRGGRTRAKNLIGKMELTPASSRATEASAPATAAAQAADSVPASPVDASLAEMEEDAPILAQEEALNDVEAPEKARNYTWVYIMCLAILVGVVIALVVYASNVLKRNAENRLGMAHQGGADAEELENYKSMVADKDTEIAMANKKLESANRQIVEMRETIRLLKEELEELKKQPKEPVVVAPVAAGVNQTQRPALRSIYLGRANTKGIFVRADRTLNIGNSVFLLETSDGYSGTFRVADNPAAWSLALSNPKEYLLTACTGYDLEDTAGVSRIITETAGTAVFEGGCWRVIRKARIRYA